MKTTKAFSLIELMVVIAIVALLAAVAIPSYKSYVISGKMGSLMPIADTLIQKSIVYANTHGKFAPASYLVGGQPTSITSYFTTGSSGMSPYLTTVKAGDISNNFNGGNGPCGQAGFVNFLINGPAIGIGTNSVAAIQCLMAYKNGAVDTQCFYNYNPTSNTAYTVSYIILAASGSLGTNNILPGATNMENNFADIAAFFAGSSCIQ